MKWSIFLPVLAVLMSSLHLSQTDPDYDKLWREVEVLDQKGLYASAEKKVEEIKYLAEKEGHQKQLLKAELYLAKYKGKLKESNIATSIEAIENALKGFEEESIRSVANTYLGNLWYHRARLEDGNYDEQESLSTALEYYQKSLDSLNYLKSIDARDWSLFLSMPELSKYPATSLADVLFSKAKNVFYDNDGRLTSYPNTLNLLPAEFCDSEHDLDSSAFINQLKLYERVLLNAGDTLRLLDALLFRLRIGPSSQSEKYDILKSFYEKYPSNRVLIRSAAIYPDAFETHRLFKAFSRTGSIPPYEQQLVRRYLKMKERPLLTHEFLEVFSSEMPVIFSVQSAYIKSIGFELYHLSPEEYEIFLTGSPGINPKLIDGKRPVHRQEYALDSTRQWVCLPILEKGKYIFKITPEASDQLSFPTELENQWGSFQISDLTSVEIKGEYLLVMDRQTGKYLPNVEVNFRSIDYRNPDVFQSLGQFKTDITGKVDIPAGDQNNRRIGFLLRAGNDEYYEAPQYRHTNNTRYSRQYSARINSGRAIYKPGETIHLQGIVLIREEKNGIHRLDFSKKLVEIIFRNQQNQVIHEEEAVIDEFGSFEASWTLPTTILPGKFHVHVASEGRILGHQSIRVEEYKAPKYELVLNSLGEKGDSMMVEGNVNAIAGYPITNAKATCEVHLQKLNWWSRIPGNNETESELIKTSVKRTDENGRFLLKWPRRPVGSDFYLSYLVNVRVQDETGEVIEESLMVPLNQDQIRVNWGDLDEKSDLRELQTTKIQFENAKGELLNLNAQWRLSFKEFKTHCHRCPEYVEAGRDHLGKKMDCQRAQVYYGSNTDLDTANYELLSEGEILAGKPFFQVQKYVKHAGHYKLELFTERDSFSKVFSWSSVERGKHDSDNPLVFLLSDHRAYAGQEIVLWLNKAVDEDLYVRYVVHQNNEIIEQKWLTVSGFLRLNIPVLESYRGNFGIHLSTVYKNKFYSENEKVEVPFSNKHLQVEYLKWPYKAGTDEKQKIVLQVKDDFGRPVETQFAISIYNKKLDEILPHAWTANYYPNYSNHLHLRAKTGETGSIYNLDFSQKDEFEYQFFDNHRLKDIFGTDISIPQLAFELSEDVEMDRVSSGKTMGRKIQMKAESEQNLEDASANSIQDKTADPSPKLRSDLASLMYFNGQINTDREGIAQIEFKTNDAISNWAVLIHGHSKDLSYYVSKEEFQTYQPVLVECNLPRFMHEGDEVVLTAKVVNRTAKQLKFVPKAVFYTDDPKNLTSLEIIKGQNLVIAENSSSSFNVRLKVPPGSENITLRFSAEGDSYGDAVEETLPVRSNTVDLVTSISIRTYQGKTTWDQEALSELLNNPDFSVDKVALEYTAHEHIPLLIALTGTFEEEERFATEIFDKWQAFVLVEHLLQKTPKIRMLFEDMKARHIPINPMADLSDYRIVDIDESKWAAAGEKTNEILYRQLDHLLNDRLRQSEIQRLWRKLKTMQNRDGGMKWCSNAINSSFSTSLHIAENYLRMHQQDLFKSADDQFIQALMTYLSDYFKNIERDEGRDIMSYDRYWLSYSLSWINWHRNVELWDPSHYVDSIKADFMNYPVGLQARLGLYLKNREDPMFDTLLQSLVERSIYDPTVGRFWNATGGWRWGEWKMNAHSWLIELFLKSGCEEKWLMELKQWLVSHKQGNAWKNASQTVDAVISFSLSPSGNLDFTNLSITKGGKRIDQGFPYFFSEWQRTVDMKDFQIENKSDFGYGAVIVKYRAKTENIETGDSSLPLTLEVNYRLVSIDGLKRIQPNEMKPGDKILTELKLTADRPMDFIVIKHNRAAGFEPTTRLSGYNWRPNPHYSANYADHQALYIEHVSRGTHSYEYEFFIEQQGTLHSGISQIQSMYAPEFVNNTDNTIFTIKNEK